VGEETAGPTGPPTLLSSRRPAGSDSERRGGRSREIGGGGKALDSREPTVDPSVKVIGGRPRPQLTGVNAPAELAESGKGH
jgi:hypothetical protein